MKKAIAAAKSAAQEALNEVAIINKNLKSKELGTVQKDISNALKLLDSALTTHNTKKQKLKDDLKKLGDKIDEVKKLVLSHPIDVMAVVPLVKKIVSGATAAEKETGKD